MSCPEGYGAHATPPPLRGDRLVAALVEDRPPGGEVHALDLVSHGLDEFVGVLTPQLRARQSNEVDLHPTHHQS
jgi:hypothetical protein